MATTTTTTNKPLNPRAQDLSPKGYNRANIFSGKALSFDGVNDYVQCANQSTLSTSSFTIAYAAKFNAIGDNWGVTQGGTSTNAAIITGRQTGNVIRFAFFGNDLDAPTSLTPAVGEWCVLAFTYDRTTNDRKIFINGRLAASDVSAADPSPTANNFRVSSYEAINGYYNNNVSNVKLFNVALTPAQVSDLYLNPEKIVPDGVASSALKLWLPMMEGAGASAYDGSGNGNDGTINGATWTAGIGAPVAQTALVSWDKGQNILTYSEDFTNAAWSKEDITITANAATAPNGTTTADFLVPNTTNTDHTIYVGGVATGSPRKFSLYAKAGGQNYIFLGSNNNTATDGAFFNLSNGTISQNTSTLTADIESAGNGWYLCSVSSSAWPQIYAIICGSLNGTSLTFAGDNTNGVYIWGASFRPTSAGDAYIKTNATAQTSAVLVPEGLTAGASIFGTDIITPRNAFALNLDGASLASVHDNASVDLTTAATFEAWVNIPSAPSLTDSGIISKYDASGSFLLSYRASGPQLGFAMYIHGGGSLISSYAIDFVPTYGAWVHVVGIYIGGTSITTFVNGAQASQNTTSIPATMTQSALNVQIGKWSGNVSDLRIANPRIYNRALTAAEVLRNYNADKAKFGL